MSEGRWRQIAEDAIEIRARNSEHAQQISKRLRNALEACEAVPGIETVTIMFDPITVNVAQVESQLLEAYTDAPTSFEAEMPQIEIDVRYGGEYGPDLNMVCEILELSEDQFIKQHSELLHRVDMIGFTPGFAYVSGLDTKHKVSRLKAPRPRLPAGSIGISGAFTGLYSLAGPGGWPIVGKTETMLFDPAAEEPFLLQPGQSVAFRSI